MASAYSEIRDDDSDSEKGLMGSESGPAGDGESRSPGQPPRKRDSAPLAYPEGGPLLMPYSPAYAESTYAVTGDLMAGFEDRYKNSESIIFILRISKHQIPYLLWPIKLHDQRLI